MKVGTVLTVTIPSEGIIDLDVYRDGLYREHEIDIREMSTEEALSAILESTNNIEKLLEKDAVDYEDIIKSQQRKVNAYERVKVQDTKN